MRPIRRPIKPERTATARPTYTRPAASTTISAELKAGLNKDYSRVQAFPRTAAASRPIFDTLEQALAWIYPTSKRRWRAGGLPKQRVPTRRTVGLPIGV